MRGAATVWLLVITTCLAVGQQKESHKQLSVDLSATNIISELDTPKQEAPSSVPAGNTQLSAPQRYSSIIGPGAISRKGLFTVHKVEDTYYFEIPDSLLGRDLLVVSRISQGAAGVRREYTGYAGDQIGNTVIRFELGPSHKLFLRRITFEDNLGDSTSAMYNAVQRSNLQPLVAAFGIGAYNPNGKSSVIDVTDYVNGDNEILFFNSGSRKTMKVGSLVSSVCYIKDIASYPMNLEIRTIKTYQESGTDNNFTLELNSSIVLLPRKPMRKRFYWNRSRRTWFGTFLVILSNRESLLSITSIRPPRRHGYHTSFRELTIGRWRSRRRASRMRSSVR